MAVTGANYVPGAVVVLGGVDLETVYGDVDRLSAFVPALLVARPGCWRCGCATRRESLRGWEVGDYGRR